MNVGDILSGHAAQVGVLVGGVLSIVGGFVDVWTYQRLGTPLDVALILGGIGALGVHVVRPS